MESSIFKTYPPHSFPSSSRKWNWWGNSEVIRGYERWLVGKKLANRWKQITPLCIIRNSLEWGVCVKGHKLRSELHFPLFLPEVPVTPNKCHSGLQHTNSPAETLLLVRLFQIHSCCQASQKPPHCYSLYPKNIQNEAKVQSQSAVTSLQCNWKILAAPLYSKMCWIYI